MILKGFFPTGKDMKFFFTLECLEYCRIEILEHRSSVYASAKTMHRFQDLQTVINFEQFYPKLQSALQHYRAIIFSINTLQCFNLSNEISSKFFKFFRKDLSGKRCLVCPKDELWLACDGNFRLCRRKAAGLRQTEPTLKHFFLPVKKDHVVAIAKSQNKNVETQDGCSNFTAGDEGRKRSKLETLDETGLLFSSCLFL
jgi:hypothetical protein